MPLMAVTDYASIVGMADMEVSSLHFHDDAFPLSSSYSRFCQWFEMSARSDERIHITLIDSEIILNGERPG